MSHSHGLLWKKSFCDAIFTLHKLCVVGRVDWQHGCGEGNFKIGHYFTHREDTGVMVAGFLEGKRGGYTDIEMITPDCGKV